MQANLDTIRKKVWSKIYPMNFGVSPTAVAAIFKASFDAIEHEVMS